MNERIKELAIEAGAGEWGDSVVPAMMNIEKFAELIVGECIFISRTSTDGFSAGRRMAERFGVGE